MGNTIRLDIVKYRLHGNFDAAVQESVEEKKEEVVEEKQELLTEEKVKSIKK